MKLSERLHLTIPLYDGADKIIAWVHSAPISREVFEAHFDLVAQTFAAIHGDGLGIIAGPRVASMVLRNFAKKSGNQESAMVLMNEIRRLSNVLMSTQVGWEMYPLQDAVDRKLIDADDLAEVENALVFFTVASAMHQKRMAKAILPGAASLWGAQISSLDCTAFAASLKTSTEAGNTGAMPTAVSSVVF